MNRKDRVNHRNILAASVLFAIALPVSSAFAVGVVRGPATHNPDSGKYDRFIVRYRDGTAPRTSDASLKQSLNKAMTAAGLSSAKGAAATTASKLRRLATGADVVSTSRKLDRAQADSLMRQLKADPNVQYVEVDARRYINMVPNDTYYAAYQWHYNNPVGGINAEAAWDHATGAGVVVAVLDTGITNHSDLTPNVLPGYDFISADSFNTSADGDGRDADPSDPGDWNDKADECDVTASSWHGTHTSGTIAELTNNNKGMAGVAFNAKIVPARVLGRCGGYTSDISDAIIWASGGTVAGVPANANPAEVINLSLGGGGACSATEQTAIDGAVSRGTTVVVSAGNQGANSANYSPGNCNNVVTVGATGINGGITFYSNYGPTVEIAAPGGGANSQTDTEFVWSTINDGETVPGAETYGGYAGTSMSAPHVSGVVALMQSVAPTPLTPAQVVATLQSTARHFPVAPPANKQIGAGIVDAAAAVNAVLNPGAPPTATILTNNVAVNGNSGAKNATVKFAIVVPAGAKNLKFLSFGGSGDADLYVNFGSEATATDYDVRSVRPGNNETLTVAKPQTGNYYVTLVGKTAFSNVSIRASFTP